MEIFLFYYYNLDINCNTRSLFQLKILYRACAMSSKHTRNSEAKGLSVFLFFTWDGTNSLAINYTKVTHLEIMVDGKQPVLATTTR